VVEVLEVADDLGYKLGRGGWRVVLEGIRKALTESWWSSFMWFITRALAALSLASCSAIVEEEFKMEGWRSDWWLRWRVSRMSFEVEGGVFISRLHMRCQVVTRCRWHVTIAPFPVVTAEVFIRTSGNSFPVHDLPLLHVSPRVTY
jgi:hypothetical protein